MQLKGLEGLAGLRVFVLQYKIVLQARRLYCIAGGIVLQETVLQYSFRVPGLYCGGLPRRLGHNTKICIVTVGCLLGRSVSQYTLVYCD